MHHTRKASASRRTLLSLAIGAALGSFGAAAQAGFITGGDAGTTGGSAAIGIAPTATFLQVQGPPGATDALVVDLVGLGVSAGEVLTFSHTGDYSVAPGQPDTRTGLLGVFSANSVLLDPNLVTRVPGALQAGPSIATPADIPQDFRFTRGSGTAVTVPVGATHLFFGIDDPFVGDNTDPDDNLILNIGIPSQQTLFAGANSGGSFVVNGGTVAEFQSALLGTRFDPAGTAIGDGLVVDPGSELRLSGNLEVGHAGQGRLQVLQGGRVTSSSPDQFLFVANAAGSRGTVEIAGLGSLVEIAGHTVVGNGAAFDLVGDGVEFGVPGTNAVGSLGVYSGGELRTGSLTLGAEGGPSVDDPVNGFGIGEVVLQGPAARIVTTDTDGGVTVGRAGTGRLVVQAGLLTTDNLMLGADPTGRGVLHVAGTPSRVIANGATTVGQQGAGAIELVGGGTLDTPFLAAGTAPGSTGVVTLVGGSVLAASDGITLGFEGTGTLDVRFASRVQTGFLALGEAATGEGHATVSGAGSTLDATFGTTVGVEGAATLDVLDSGRMNTDFLSVGLGTGSSGRVTLQGAHSAILANGGASIGEHGEGSLDVFGGSRLETPFVAVGDRAGSSGRATVAGAGSTLAGSDGVTVGYDGTGTLDVLDGGRVSTDFFTVGEAATGVGHGTVRGAGSTVDATFDVTVGYEGSGTLGVLDGGRVNTDFFSVGRFAGSTGEVDVHGAGSAIDGSNGTIIGMDGSGVVDVRSGGTLGAQYVELGYFETGDGSATVSGSSSVVRTAGEDNRLVVGRTGTGSLRVEAGGLVDTLQFDVAFDGAGTAVVTGAGSKIIVSNDNGHFSAPFDNEAGFLRVGRDAGGDGRLEVLDGATVAVRATNTESGPGVQVARNAGSRGTILVDGAGSRIDVTQTAPATTFDGGPFAQIGRGGDGELLIRNGGVFSMAGDEAGLQAGRDAGSTGRLEVTGAGSTLHIEGADSFLNIATNGSASLAVSGGGRVDSLFMNVGRNAGSVGTMTVDGEGSSLHLSGDGKPESGDFGAFANIGRSGTGTVSFVNGADFVIEADLGDYPGLWLGRTETGVGTLNLDGSGTTLRVSGNATTPPGEVDDGKSGWIAVGGAGSGTMNVTGGAKVFNDPAGMTIVGGDAPAGSTPGSGVLTVTGAGSRFDAGAKLMVASNPYGVIDPWGFGVAAQTSGGSGTVSIGGGAVLNAPQLWVGGGGVVNGNGGTIDGSVYLFDGGILAPGNSPGDLFITGDLDLSGGGAFPGGVLEIEIAGTGPGEFDRLFVGGDLQLFGGEIRFQLLGGLLPSALELFDIGDFLKLGTDPGTAVALTDFGELNDVSFTGFADGFGPFAFTFDAVDGGFSVRSQAGVPEPHVLALIAAGLLVVACARGRRQRETS